MAAIERQAKAAEMRVNAPNGLEEESEYSEESDQSGAAMAVVEEEPMRRDEMREQRMAMERLLAREHNLMALQVLEDFKASRQLPPEEETQHHNPPLQVSARPEPPSAVGALGWDGTDLW